MNTKNLIEKAKTNYGDIYYYELFSSALDYPNKILSELKKEVKNKIVLDAGCGSGKFLPVVSKLAKYYYGIDISSEQLFLANNKIINKEKVTLLCLDLCDISLEDNSIDIIYLSWVLGTILDLDKRDRVLKELLRVLKPGGKILLIENNVDNEFEEIRGRTKDNRTKDYNKWVLSNNFKVFKQFNTYFKFNNTLEAKKVFDIIYGVKVASKVSSSKINHNIVIFELIK